MAEESVTPLPEEEKRRLVERYAGFREGLAAAGPGRHLLPPHSAKFLNKYREFRFRETDVLIATFPRSGTTWTQELVWTMRNNLDFSTASAMPLILRSPFLELDSLSPRHLPPPEDLIAKLSALHPNQDFSQEGAFLGLADASPDPRTLKTHLPFSLLPADLLDTCKVVYVARNPRDVCVSYYHHQRLVKAAEFLGDFPEFMDFWCRDLVLQAPYWGHLEEAWERREHPNLLFLYYEDMKEDLVRELRRLNSFMGTALTEEQLQQVASHGAFSNMKSREATNPSATGQGKAIFTKGEQDFVRKGITGNWVSYFTPELESKFQSWMAAAGGEVGKKIPFKYQLGKAEAPGEAERE